MSLACYVLYSVAQSLDGLANYSSLLYTNPHTFITWIPGLLINVIQVLFGNKQFKSIRGYIYGIVQLEAVNYGEV